MVVPNWQSAICITFLLKTGQIGENKIAGQQIFAKTDENSLTWEDLRAYTIKCK
jgi:hypothetical protein